MALIKCPECGNEISDKAYSCPKCGCPIKQEKIIIVKKDYKGKARAFTIAGIMIFVISFIVASATYDKRLSLAAAYVTGKRNLYPVYNALLEATFWISLGIIGIGIIYWIIAAVNKNK